MKDLARNTYAVTICENGSYCCGNGTFADTCCSLKQGVFLVNGSTTPENPISFQSPLTPSIFSSVTVLTPSTSITVAAPTASSSSIPSESPSNVPSTSRSPAPTSKNKAALATGAIVGGAVGGFAGVAVLILAVWIWKLRSRRVLQSLATSRPDSRSEPQNEAIVPKLSELDGDNGSREIGGADLMFELDPSRTWHEMH